MKNKLIITLVLGIFLLSSVSALIDLGSVDYGESIKIRQVCADATYINISSISFTNGSDAVTNIEMISSGSGEFFYFFNNTYDFGRHDVLGISDGCEKTFATYFIVGKELTNGKAIIYVGFILILLFTFFLTIYGAGKVKWKNKQNNEGKILTINNFRYIKILLYSISYFELMFLFGLSYKIFNEAGIEGFTQFFNFIYQLFLVLIYPLMIFLIIIIFVTWINNSKLQKRIKLGLGK